MAHSTILGADSAPTYPSGRDSERLGPSDSSDSGSDTIGTDEAQADSDSTGTGERAAVGMGTHGDGEDILPDHVVRLGQEESVPEDEANASEFTDVEAENSPGESPGGDEDEPAAT